MKKTTTAAILTMIAAIAVSGLTVAEENSKFTTNIDSSMEQDGKREIAELQSTAVTETIERNSDGVLNGNTAGSANSSNRGIANAAGDLRNRAMETASALQTDVENAQNTANSAMAMARSAQDAADAAPETFTKHSVTSEVKYRSHSARYDCRMSERIDVFVEYEGGYTSRVGNKEYVSYLNKGVNADKCRRDGYIQNRLL